MSGNQCPSTRGALRLYLGAAPGVGKTYAALSEARRRAERGTDVAVGFVETYGRHKTEELLDGLEILPRRQLTSGVTEMDVDRCWRGIRRWWWSMSWLTPTPPVPATPSGGRTSRSCSPPGSRCCPR